MKNRTSINQPTAIKIMACNLMLCLVISSCMGNTERVKVVELQGIEVDTTYIYKIERIDEDKKFYDIEKRTQKLKAGDYIEILRWNR